MNTSETLKILLVDDEEGIRKVLGIALTDSGYAVYSAETGEGALKIFREIHPSIVLTDIKMPGMDGIELLKTIKQENPDTEVVMISGHGDMDLAIESLKLEATDFITKPINDDVLEIALKRCHEKIFMRRRLREYTENLEDLVRKKSAQLVALERKVAVGQAVEGFSSAISDIADNLGDGIRYFNEMPCYVSIHDGNLTVVATNQLFTDRLGSKVGQNSWDIYSGDKARRTTCPVAQTFSAGKGQRTKATVRYADGSEVPAIVHTAPIRNQNGEIELVVEITADMTEIKRLREALQTTQDQLASLGLKISSISHGIKGLLTGLDGGMYLLDSGFKKENQVQIKEGWEVAKNMVERIRNMVLDILFFAKERDLQWERVDVLRFAREITLTIEPKIRKQDIGFVKDLDPGLGEFEIDAGIVQSALINILENAIDACVEDTSLKSHTITFAVRQDQDTIIFDVFDDGIGMDQETQESLFSLFFSSKGSKGTGLGLFISNKIIEQHGGTIKVTSTPGQGSHFSIMLPKNLPESSKTNSKPITET